MKFRNYVVLCFIWCFLFPVTSVCAQAKFVGESKCKMCHQKSKDGNAYRIWKNSNHAKAYKDLGSKEAKQYAEKLGIKTHPQKSLECLICHAAGAELPKNRFASSFDPKSGVQCENCHGPGEKYKKKKIMERIYREHLAGKYSAAKKYELVQSNEQTCISQCHQSKRVVNDITYINPTYKGFDYLKQIKQIAHPTPPK
ncbi:cytochrome c family protein [bacterium]|nr:cytochrome c family protein [bacterium]